MAETFGSDWTTTLGAAMLEDDGTVRAPDDIAALWDDLSEEDRVMIRRDCELFVAEAERRTEDDTEVAATETDSTEIEREAATDLELDATSEAPVAEITPVVLTMEQMEEICATTSNLWGSATDTD